MFCLHAAFRALTNGTSIGALGALFSLGPCSDSNRWRSRKQRLISLGYARVTAIRITGVQEAIAGAQEATAIQIAGVHEGSCDPCRKEQRSRSLALTKMQRNQTDMTSHS